MRDPPTDDGNLEAAKKRKPKIDPELLPANKHAPTPLEKQRLQLAKLLQDPTREIQLPKPPKEKSLRPPREMMKNVQGSSAGAGSGEFHVYKQSRRREYERLRLMDEQEQKEKERVEFETKQAELRERADLKTSKNRQKRQKRKQSQRSKKADKPPGALGPQRNHGADERSDESEEEAGGVEGKGKKRKLGAAPVAEGMVFKQPALQDDQDSDSDNDDDDDDDDRVGAEPADPQQAVAPDGSRDESSTVVANPVVEPKGLTIVEDDW